VIGLRQPGQATERFPTGLIRRTAPSLAPVALSLPRWPGHWERREAISIRVDTKIAASLRTRNDAATRNNEGPARGGDSVAGNRGGCGRVDRAIEQKVRAF
jgi:hypothetical protein